MPTRNMNLDAILCDHDRQVSHCCLANIKHRQKYLLQASVELDTRDTHWYLLVLEAGAEGCDLSKVHFIKGAQRP
jgi:hypothetical protein